jgi:hypothetical protein
MADPHAATPPRPCVALRVGVTGARELSPDSVSKIRKDVADILRSVASKARGVARENEAIDFYGPQPPTLRVLSPLAAGADRVVAEVGLELGFALYAPLPFARDDYRADFPGDGDYDRLLAHADVFELDGARVLNEESYREVGRFVVRNSDLVLAIWDGEPVRKVGGTSETVRFALQSRVPVWWIDANGERPPRLLRRAADLRDADPASIGDAAHGSLSYYLDRILLPPQEDESQRALDRYLAGCAAPNRGRLRRALAWFFDVYERMIDLLALRGPSRPRARMQVRGWWDDYYRAADCGSILNAGKYRNSYVWIAFLVFVGLTASALGHYQPDRHPASLIAELLALLGIGALALRNHLCSFHENWIACRLLAELCRQQSVLSSVGRSLPPSDYEYLAWDRRLSPRLRDLELETPFEAWAAWYFAAVQRAAPFPSGDIATANAEARRIGLELVEEQHCYHRDRLEQQRAAGRRVNRIGVLSFGATLLLVAAQAVLLAMCDRSENCIPSWLPFATGAFSALSGAVIGVRVYAEFFLLARQSTLMLRALAEAERDLREIDLTHPLASRDLGRTLLSVSLAMMQDIKGWSQLYGVKHLEPG